MIIDDISKPSKAGEVRSAAMSRWEEVSVADTTAGPGAVEEPHLTNTELVQLRVRVIALENIVIALLAGGSDRLGASVREMAVTIAPHAGATSHPLTVHAATNMIQLLDRASHFRAIKP